MIFTGRRPTAHYAIELTAKAAQQCVPSTRKSVDELKNEVKTTASC